MTDPNSTLDAVEKIIAIVVGVPAAIAALRYAAIRMMKPITEAMGNLRSIPAISEDIALVKKEVLPNGGASLRDSVIRNEEMTVQMKADVALNLSISRQTLDMTGAIAFMAEADGSYFWVSLAWSEITGIGNADAAGSGWQAAIAPEDRDHVRREWESCCKEAWPFRMTYSYLHPNGSKVRVEATASAIHNDKGKVIKFFGKIHKLPPQEQTHAAPNPGS